MPSPAKNTFKKAPTRLFGQHRETRQPGAPLKVTEETTVWEIYTHEADLVDRERIKDWNDSLNTLLIFAALYSGVLTAFIIESMQLLQEDTSETTQAILVQISQQLANSSLPAYSSSNGNFSPPAWAVGVNYCFFISVSCSLVTALVAVLALQWVSSYDRGLNQSSPEDRALQRQFRDQGIEKWKMEQIIAFLPAVIFFSLFIFFVGLAQWLLHIHRGVAAIVITGVAVGAIIFWATTLISMIEVKAPFRTPASRSLPTYLVFAQKIAAAFLSPLSPTTLKPIYEKLKGKASSIRSTISNWYHNRHATPTPIHLPTLPTLNDLPTLPKISIEELKSGLLKITDIKTVPAKAQELIPSFDRPIAFMSRTYHSLFCDIPFDKRERDVISSKGAAKIKRSTLVWLANSLSIVPTQKNAFIILVQAILDLPMEQLLDERVNHAPWTAIFTALCQDYFSKRYRSDFTDEELADVTFLLRGLAFIGRGSCNSEEFKTLFQALYVGNTDLTRMFANLAYWRHIEEDDSTRHTTIVESFEYCVLYREKWPLDIVTATLTCLKMDIKKQKLPPDLLIGNLEGGLSVNARALSNEKLMPIKTLDTILEICAIVFATKPLPNPDEPLAFLTAMEQYRDTAVEHLEYPNQAERVAGAYSAVSQQISAHLRQSQDDAEGKKHLNRLQGIVRSSLWKDNSHGSVAHILLSLARTRVFIWGEDRTTVAQLLAQTIPEPFDFDGQDWDSWWMKMIIGFSKLLEGEEMTDEILRDAILENVRTAVANGVLPDPEKVSSETMVTLKAISDKHMRFIASRVFRSADLALSTLPLPESLDHDPVWRELLKFYCEELGSIFSEPNIPFLREVTLTGPPIIYDSIKPTIENKLSSSSNSYEYFQRPVLARILQSRNNYPVMRTLEIISTHPWFIGEFKAADGHLLLPWCVFESNIWLEEALDVIYKALPSLNTYQDLNLWIECIQLCLLATGVSLEGKMANWMTMMGYARKNVPKLTSRLHNMIDVWAQDREKMGKETEVQPRASFIDERPTDSQESLPDCDPRIWSAEEWETLQAMVDEVVPGLERGYIMAGSSVDKHQFMRDPDGWCSHSHQMKHEFTAAETRRRFKQRRTLGRHPRDPDGLCIKRL